MTTSLEYLVLLDEVENAGEPYSEDPMALLGFLFEEAYETGRQVYKNAIPAYSLELPLFTLTIQTFGVYATYSGSWSKIFKDARKLHEDKCAGYAGRTATDPWINLRVCEKMGIAAWAGCMVRMGDKYSRITALINDPSNDKVGESILDNLIDLASYALMAICLLREHKV